MRLAFTAFRRGHLKVVGSVIDEALRRGHQCALLWQHDDKPGENVLAYELTALWPRATTCAMDAVRGERFDAVIGDPSIHAIPGLPDARLYALDFGWEQRMRPDLPYITRCWATDVHRGLFLASGPVTGMTALDAIPLVDPKDVREANGLDDKPVLLLFSAKLGVPHLWRKTVFKHFWYPSILHALKDYAKRHGMLLVIKTREKHHDPELLLRLGDRILDDRDLWPYTSAQIVTTANLVVHFQSGAIFEALAANVPQVSVRLPQPHLEHFTGHDVVFSREPYTMQHWPGVVQAADYKSVVPLFRDDLVDTAIDPAQRERYAERYTGPLDGKNACRVLDVVERG